MRLGVVGHRLDKLTHRDLEFLRKPVIAVLDELNGLASIGRPLSVIASLAEGADRLVTGEAIELDIPVHVVLPFERDRFSLDFDSAESRTDYRDLLDKASTIVEPLEQGVHHSAGYHWASETIVANADVLIAIWDGQTGRGPGGTASTINAALAADVPVVWLLSRSPWTIDVVEPDTGLQGSPVHRLLTALRAPNARAGAADAPLTRKRLRLV